MSTRPILTPFPPVTPNKLIDFNHKHLILRMFGIKSSPNNVFIWQQVINKNIPQQLQLTTCLFHPCNASFPTASTLTPPGSSHMHLLSLPLSSNTESASSHQALTSLPTVLMLSIADKSREVLCCLCSHVPEQCL